jgi:hypothetical protein
MYDFSEEYKYMKENKSFVIISAENDIFPYETHNQSGKWKYFRWMQKTTKRKREI